MCRPWTGAARMPPLDGQGRHNAAPAAPGFSHFRPRPWKIFFLPHQDLVKKGHAFQTGPCIPSSLFGTASELRDSVTPGKWVTKGNAWQKGSCNMHKCE